MTGFAVVKSPTVWYGSATSCGDIIGWVDGLTAGLDAASDTALLFSSAAMLTVYPKHARTDRG